MRDVPDASDFRLAAHSSPPPAWALGAVVYQIFPDRFARSARPPARSRRSGRCPATGPTPVIGQGPGPRTSSTAVTWTGSPSRLDHLDHLGVNTVYLTPVFPARSNHRYDATAFHHVDPLLGGDAALARLADAVHARGWRLIGDITSNHTGDGHDWFTAASADRQAPERELYYFTDGDTGGGDGTRAAGGDYGRVRSLPKLNWGSAELRREFATAPDSVLRRWLRRRTGWTAGGWTWPT